MSEILKRAKEQERKGNWDEAIAEYRELRHMEPCPTIVYNLLGDLYHKKGDAEEAVSLYRQAVENYTREELYGNAIGICRKILRHYPDRSEMIEQLGGLFFSQGFIRESVKHYMDFAERMMYRSDTEGVCRAAEMLRQIASDDPEMRERLGDMMRSVSMADESIADYRAALDIQRREEMGEAVERLSGKIREIGGDPDMPSEEVEASAGPVFEDAVPDGMPEDAPAGEKEPADIGADDLITTIDSAIGSMESGEEIVEEHASDLPAATEPLTPIAEESPEPEDAELLSAVSEFCESVEGKGASDPPDTGKPQEDYVPVAEILSEFKEGVEKILDADDFQSHYDMGMSYKEMGLGEEALSEFYKASKSPLLRSACVEMMGAVLLDSGRLEEGVQTLRTLVDGGDGDALGVHFVLGQAYEHLGERERALVEYCLVEQRDPGFRDVRERISAIRG